MRNVDGFTLMVEIGICPRSSDSFLYSIWRHSEGVME